MWCRRTGIDVPRSSLVGEDPIGKVVNHRAYNIPNIRARPNLFDNWADTVLHLFRLSNNNVVPETTHLLSKGKYYCKAHLLFYCFGFNQTSHSVNIVSKAIESKLAKQNMSHSCGVVLSNTKTIDVCRITLLPDFMSDFLYQFLGVKGNYEPMRDFVEAGPGENGEAHHTRPEQQNDVAQTVQEFGKIVVGYFT